MINRALVVMNGLLLIAVITRCASTRIAKPASMTLSELNIVRSADLRSTVAGPPVLRPSARLRQRTGGPSPADQRSALLSR
jgi:hypothetical protein